MREFANRKKSDEEIKGFKVSYYLKEALNQRGDKDLHDTHITITERRQELNVSPGEIHNGIMDGISDFGLFIKFEGNKGLLHSLMFSPNSARILTVLGNSTDFLGSITFIIAKKYT